MFLLALAVGALGYMVGPALTLDKLAQEADLIFKAEAITSQPVEDASFTKVSGYGARETRFRVISLIKGAAVGDEIRFRHYDEDAGGGLFTPQYYHFEPGSVYIVCAKETPEGARQTRNNHTAKMDLGSLRCRDKAPVTGKTLPEIYWTELMALRDSPNVADVVYALEQLGGMSEGSERAGTKDFSRLEVLNAIHKLVGRAEPEIANAAIRLLGSGSPYLSDTTAPYWLGTIGVSNPGLAQMDHGTRNPGGALCWRELAAVANSNAGAETRALAIRAMGLVRAREIHQMMDPWLKSPDAPIRAASVLLYTDFAVPHSYTTEVFGGFAADQAPEVRKCAAYAIGFTQDAGLLPVLTKLLKDSDADTRRAARESLHSFHPEIPAVHEALKADLDNPETHPLTLLTLARDNPVPYLEQLAKVVEQKPEPKNWGGGEIPAFTAWKLLFKHLRAQPPEDIRSGKWDRYLDVLEQVGSYSSSEPRDIYAFYLQRKMPKRAAKYREQAKKNAGYDLDYFFNEVDKSAETFQGN